jgi:hypothetical protein
LRRGIRVADAAVRQPSVMRDEGAEDQARFLPLAFSGASSSLAVLPGHFLPPRGFFLGTALLAADFFAAGFGTMLRAVAVNVE